MREKRGEKNQQREKKNHISTAKGVLMNPPKTGGNREVNS